MDVAKVFEDENARYYIHGTGRTGNDFDNSVVNSIMNNGLVAYSGAHGTGKGCKDLPSTAAPIGFGSSNLYKDAGYDALHNNVHLGSKKTIIIALPRNYIFPDFAGLTEMQESAFTEEKSFFIDEEEQECLNENDCKDLAIKTVFMSEFIVGAYDANIHKFIPNKKYIKNLKKERQQEVLKKVHQGYVQHLKEYIKNSTLNSDVPFTIDDYLKIFDSPNKYQMPLTSEDIKNLKQYSNKILKQKEIQECETQEDSISWNWM